MKYICKYIAISNEKQFLFVVQIVPQFDSIL